jgi:hypothetical protein
MRDELLRSRLRDTAQMLASIDPPRIAVLRRRVRRRRLRLGTATLAVSAALGAVGAAVVPWPPTGSRPPVARPAAARHGTARHAAASWQPAGPQPAADAGPSAAPYLITVVFQRAPADVEVVDVFTGTVVATVQPPAATAQNGFTGVQAAGDDRTFFLEDQLTGGRVAFYELRLGADGKPRSLTQVAAIQGPIQGATLPFAISPDATRLAYTDGGELTVVSLATGAHRTWTATQGTAGDPSWAGDRMLAFGWDGDSPSDPRAGIHLLDTSAPGSDLLAAPLIPLADRALPGGFGGAYSSLIAADGSVLFATAANGSQTNPLSEVVEYSVRTGRLLAEVTPAAGESGMGTSCMVLWTDSSGAQAVAECGGAFAFDHTRYRQRDLRLPSYNNSEKRQNFVAW